MTTDHWTKARVVDLLRYKQERGQRRLPYGAPGSDRLRQGYGGPPKLHAKAEDPGLQVSGPTLAFVHPFRQLTGREVAHRQRMVEFLGGKAVRSQK